MSKVRAIVGFFILLFIFSLLIIFFLRDKTYPQRVVINNKAYIVEVSDNKGLLEKGLSGHAPLLEDEGMLFIFNYPGEYGIWMKDMTFPIDIVWISENNRVVHTEKAVTPKTYPKIFYPGENSLYVLEVSSGQIDKLNIKNGDLVEIIKSSSGKLGS